MSTSLLWGISGAFSSLLALSVQLALLIVTLTTVQKRRPDALPLLLGSTALDLLTTVIGYPTPFLLSRLLPVASYVEAQALSTVVFSICHAVAKLILIFAIVKLVTPSDADA